MDAQGKPGLRAAWTLARPYWRRDRLAWGMLAALIASTLSIVWINVRFSTWNNDFYDALQAHDLALFWRQILVFGVLAAAYIALAVARLNMQQRLLIRWREGMTEQLLARWLQPGTPCRVNAGELDNPDQRIAEDIRSFAGTTLELGLGLLNAVVTLLSFIVILWQLSGRLHVPWPAHGWDLPGHLVWIAIVYSAAGSVIVHWLGAPLISANVRQQQVEADFRYGLVQVRDHAEVIALARGEPAEHRRLRSLFEAIRGNWSLLIRYNKRLTAFSAGYAQAAVVFPLLAAAPRYFAGQIQLGGLMQTAQAFGQVQGALSWFVDAYGSLADWRATVLRLTAFRDRLHDDTPPALPTPDDAYADRGAMLQARRIVVGPPGERPLLEVPELSLHPGDWLLVTGPTGSGKSSLLRTLAGLWPARAGHAQVPADAMFVPQRPDLPHGTLEEVLAYPCTAQAFRMGDMVRALHDAELAALVPRLHDAEAWSQRLSPGEQQRLQFARVFLHRPSCILLDEATSALDEQGQERLLYRLRAEAPQSAVLHIGHRAELVALHDRLMQVRCGRLLHALPSHATGAA